ncbi:hypothetical protein F4821DRAFT_261151 [Hypoxylon rubiginosum]|uniref:Uncharacterized protein n=1 Tax=Hypoxylon rubiginosum TaxID=110542 RepID=A0ACC0CXG5_9PEZI|nr:hypothetical protein F4821DRAFT_261151 [Hypoxylon rubiginosum]
MSPATVPKKSQPSPTIAASSASTASSMPNEENTSSNANTKQRDPKDMTLEEIQKLFRESRKRVAMMSPEEEAKAFPWLERFKNVTPIPPSQVPDAVWDEL